MCGEIDMKVIFTSTDVIDKVYLNYVYLQIRHGFKLIRDMVF